MGRRNIGEENIRKISRTGASGASYAITIPKRIVKSLGWREKQKVVVKREGKKVIIEDWKES